MIVFYTTKANARLLLEEDFERIAENLGYDLEGQNFTEWFSLHPEKAVLFKSGSGVQRAAKAQLEGPWDGRHDYLVIYGKGETQENGKQYYYASFAAFNYKAQEK